MNRAFTAGLKAGAVAAALYGALILGIAYNLNRGHR